MKFQLEQIALCPADSEAAEQLLIDMGLDDWIIDQVSARGEVFGRSAVNEATLRFNYQSSPESKGPELEILSYTSGRNWMDDKKRRNSVSHLGMHCTDAELNEWREFFAERGIAVAQEVLTHKHTNPVIAGKRRYNYVIFDTRDILGVDLKFIVRWNAEAA